jgi:hypothetical protein
MGLVELNKAWCEVLLKCENISAVQCSKAQSRHNSSDNKLSAVLRQQRIWH